MILFIIVWVLVGLSGAYYRRAELADDKTNEFWLDDMIIGFIVSMIFGPIMFGKPLANWLHRPIGSRILPPPIPPPASNTPTQALLDRIKDLEEENRQLKAMLVD